MQPDLYNDVRKKLLAVMILVPLMPFIASLSIGYSSYRSSMKKAVRERLEQTAEKHVVLISSFLQERIADLDIILSSRDEEYLSNSVNLKKILVSFQRASLAFVDLGFINDKGVQVAYAGPHDLTGKEYSKTRWYKEARASGSYVSDVFLGYRQKPHFIIAVTALKNNKPWILRATIDQSVFGSLVKAVSIGSTGEAYIVNRSGMLQTAKRSGGSILEKTPHSPLSSKNSGDTAYIQASTQLNNGMWQLVVRQQTNEALHELDWASLAITIICVTGGAFILCLAFMLSERFIAMLRKKEQERHEMEHHLMRAAQLAELGEMSAGFAHEINNPLQIMKSELALMEILADENYRMGLIPDDYRREYLESLEQLHKQIDRCASITQSILKFGRHAEPQITDINLSTFLPEMCTIVKRKAEVAGIDFSCSVPGDTPTIQGDASQLQQIVLNLINNATQAIQDRRKEMGGQLKVVAQRDGENHVQILVQDNGIGIAQENLERIFSPFFTTKPPGKGTGLGLSICHAIIEAMGGKIDVTSCKGEGTVIAIQLPVQRRQ